MPDSFFKYLLKLAFCILPLDIICLFMVKSDSAAFLISLITLFFILFFIVICNVAISKNCIQGK